MLQESSRESRHAVVQGGEQEYGDVEVEVAHGVEEAGQHGGAAVASVEASWAEDKWRPWQRWASKGPHTGSRSARSSHA